MKTVTIEQFKAACIELWKEEPYLQILVGPNLMENAMAKLAYKLFGDDSLVKESGDHKTPDQKIPEAIDDTFLNRLEKIVRAKK